MLLIQWIGIEVVVFLFAVLCCAGLGSSIFFDCWRNTGFDDMLMEVVLGAWL